jgi:hypothetical protein
MFACGRECATIAVAVLVARFSGICSGKAARGCSAFTNNAGFWYGSEFRRHVPRRVDGPAGLREFFMSSERSGSTDSRYIGFAVCAEQRYGLWRIELR